MRCEGDFKESLDYIISFKKLVKVNICPFNS